MPSMCGQSLPKMTRSAPIQSTTAYGSSSQNGFIQTCRRNVSTGSSVVQPGDFFAVERSFLNSSGRNSDPFSMDASRRFGKRTKIWSKIDVIKKSNAARSMAKPRMLGRIGPPPNVDSNLSLAYPCEL